MSLCTNTTLSLKPERINFDGDRATLILVGTILKIDSQESVLKLCLLVDKTGQAPLRFDVTASGNVNQQFLTDEFGVNDYVYAECTVKKIGTFVGRRANTTILVEQSLSLCLEKIKRMPRLEV